MWKANNRKKTEISGEVPVDRREISLGKTLIARLGGDSKEDAKGEGNKNDYKGGLEISEGNYRNR